MRTVLATLISLVFCACAQASGGQILTPTLDPTWMQGTAGFSVTNSCSSKCSWRAVAETLPAMYPCQDSPFNEVGDIAWQSSDLTQAGTVGVPSTAFAGPGVPARICLYIDRQSGGDHYLLAAYAAFTPNSLPNPSETFTATITDRVRPWRWHWFRTALRSRAA
jgi:hypothetical protein